MWDENAPLPQYMVLHFDEEVQALKLEPTTLFEIWRKDVVEEYYEEVINLFYWNKWRLLNDLPYHSGEIYHRYVYRLKPEYSHRQIKRGYGDKSKGKKMVKYFNIER